MQRMKKLIVSIMLLLLTTSICVLISIYGLERAFNMSPVKLTTYVFNKDSYDYTLLIPSTWSFAEQSLADTMFVSDNGEKMKFSFKERTVNTGNSDMDLKTVGSQFLLTKRDSYPEITEEPKVKDLEIGKTFYTNLSKNGYNVVLGVVQYNDFIVEFEYSLDEKLEINKSLEAIIGNIKRFQIEEVSSNAKIVSASGQSSEEHSSEISK